MVDILDQYRAFVDFLGEILSPNFEIALLDLRKDVNCITRLANGQVTGREVGAPITDLALQIIQSNAYKTQDYLVNYTGLSCGNKLLRSSSFFIKDGETLLGMLCINIDMSAYIHLCEKIMDLSGTNVASVELVPKSRQSSNHEPVEENFSNDLLASISKIINEQSKKLSTTPDRLKKSERIAFIEELNKVGLFLMKGSIPAVSAHLKCSEATIYRYLSKINESKL